MAKVKWDPSSLAIEESFTVLPQDLYEEKMKKLAALILRARHSTKLKLKTRRKNRLKANGPGETWEQKKSA